MRLIPLFLAAALPVLAADPPSPAPATDAAGFVSLFNGTDLSRWRNGNVWWGTEGKPDTFSVKDGMIHSTGQPVGFIRSDQQYENFILELEWRHLKRSGNAGLFIWSAPTDNPGKPFAKSIEVQILDHGYKEDYEKGGKKATWFTCHGDVFAIHGQKLRPFAPNDGNMRSFPSEERSKPSPEWNHYRVTCQDGTVRLAVNGKDVSGGDGVLWRKGYLCLESEGSPVDFRNIRIKELPSTHPKPEEIAPLADPE